MNQNSLFRLTRLRLVGWYAGVMSLILTLFGLTVYGAIAYTRWKTLDREVEFAAKLLQHNIEPTLRQPREIEPNTQKLLADICLIGPTCLAQTASKTNFPYAIDPSDHYYVRLLDLSGHLMAFTGSQPEQESFQSKEHLGQVIKGRQGNHYYQISLLLSTSHHLAWGNLQVGRSLDEFDRELTYLKLTLLLGLPTAMLLVGGASWWLAQLAMKPIYQSYQQMEQFSADVAHELRTPLASSQVMVESTLRLNHISDQESRQTLRAVERQNNRLSQLVRDLLLLSHVQQKGVAAKHQPCCLNDIISNLVEELAPLALKADVKLDYEAQNLKMLHVLGNEEQLYRLVANLISNAIQYTPREGQVTIRLFNNEHSAQIQISDTGVGMSNENQSRIFDRFYRADNNRSRSTGGSGLGLSIAQAIAQAHQGQLEVQSQLGKGSTFIIKLPFKDVPIKLLD